MPKTFFTCTADCFSAVYVGGSQCIRCFDVDARYEDGLARHQDKLVYDVLPADQRKKSIPIYQSYCLKLMKKGFIGS